MRRDCSNSITGSVRKRKSDGCEYREKSRRCETDQSRAEQACRSCDLSLTWWEEWNGGSGELIRVHLTSRRNIHLRCRKEARWIKSHLISSSRGDGGKLPLPWQQQTQTSVASSPLHFLFLFSCLLLCSSCSFHFLLFLFTVFMTHFVSFIIFVCSHFLPFFVFFVASFLPCLMCFLIPFLSFSSCFIPSLSFYLLPSYSWNVCVSSILLFPLPSSFIFLTYFLFSFLFLFPLILFILLFPFPLLSMQCLHFIEENDVCASTLRKAGSRFFFTH